MNLTCTKLKYMYADVQIGMSRYQKGKTMNILLINSVCGIGSTGKICGSIAEQYEREGHSVKIAYGRDEIVPECFQRFAVQIGKKTDVKIHAIRTRLFDDHGFGSKLATKNFLRWADEYNPDLVWLHNIHGYYINVEMLFQWIKCRPHMQVKWTLHDCWAFTGHCVHFMVAKCDAWKAQCGNCPEKGVYPSSILLDNSKNNYIRKKIAFTGVKNMTIIVPSEWLANLVKQSFLKEYPVEVQYNQVDSEIFKPTSSDFRQKYGLEQKKIVLGVASVWTDRKGLADFHTLATMLHGEWVIVLVGLSERQSKDLPDNMIAVPRTHSPVELAQVYSAADVFVNPSKEETFGMTTLEAILCGTPAVVYSGTACEEVVNEYGGIAVEPGVENIYKQILKFL